MPGGGENWAAALYQIEIEKDVGGMKTERRHDIYKDCGSK